MKKRNSKGFMLIETLIVTTFVSGVLLFLFTQLLTLGNNYDNSYHYNTIESLYQARNIKNYITSDLNALNIINDKIGQESIIDILDCSIFTEKNYCSKLFELYNIKNIFITNNHINKELFDNYNEELKTFVKKINSEGTEKYRILVEFEGSKYATIRFGD